MQECNRIVDTTSSCDGTNQNNHQSANHNASLDKVGSANGKISAHKRVKKYDQGAKNHHGCVIETEQRSKQLAARYEATTYIDREEQQDNQCGNGHKDVLGIVESI